MQSIVWLFDFMPGWNECLQSRLSTQAQAGCARFYLFPSFWYIFPHLQTGAFQQVPNLPFTVSGTSFCYQGWDVARWEKNLLSRSDFLVWCTWMALLFCLTLYLDLQFYKLLILKNLLCYFETLFLHFLLKCKKSRSPTWPDIFKKLIFIGVGLLYNIVLVRF